MQPTNSPKVSVILPNLNNRPYLDERIQTILSQTFTDWELVIVDNYSDDGAWEFFQTFASQDPRLRISQAPREGMYANWNNGIRLARGEYIYIATSDDTMLPTCLEKMVTAMDAHPDCGICHTLLQVIDEQGNEVKGRWEKMSPAKYYGELMNQPHIRLAPHDGILYCAFDSVYISLTQLLIRRAVFEQVGLFRTDWGSMGDFEWCMRAASTCNTLHLPETLATWRVHSQQATQLDSYRSSDHQRKLIEMVESAFPTLQTHNPGLLPKLRLDKLLFIYQRQRLRLVLKEHPQGIQKLWHFLTVLAADPKFIAEFLYRRAVFPRSQADDFIYIQAELKRLGLEHNIKVLEEMA